jgi:hypothetical protein
MMYSRPSAKRMIMRRDVIERALPSCVIRGSHVSHVGSSSFLDGSACGKFQLTPRETAMETFWRHPRVEE